jgi:hypothetical protein
MNRNFDLRTKSQAGEIFKANPQGSSKNGDSSSQSRKHRAPKMKKWQNEPTPKKTLSHPDLCGLAWLPCCLFAFSYFGVSAFPRLGVSVLQSPHGSDRIKPKRFHDDSNGRSGRRRGHVS